MSEDYPDYLYRDAIAKQEPTGAYRAPSEIDEVEARLKTAHAHMRYAAECVDKALAAHIHSRSKRLVAEMASETQKRGEYDDQPAGCNAPIQPARQTAKQAYDTQTARDVAWSAKRGDLPPNLAAAVTAPNCDGYAYLPDIGIGDVEPRHPMQAEALRDHDERLYGGEDRL